MVPTMFVSASVIAPVIRQTESLLLSPPTRGAGAHRPKSHLLELLNVKVLMPVLHGVAFDRSCPHTANTPVASVDVLNDCQFRHPLTRAGSHDLHAALSLVRH